MEKSGRKPNKAVYIVISILLACALWLYVRNVENPDTKVTVSNIPVTFEGEDVLNKSNLMLTGDKPTVSLEVQGKWTVVSRLRRDNVMIRADVSRVMTPGEHNLAYDIVLPEGVSSSNVAVLERSPFYVPVTVERRASQQVELKGVFSGSVAQGYQAGEFSFQPETVEISGTETEVAQVAYARVELKREQLDETVREEMTYTLIGQDGEPVPPELVSASPATVAVTYPVTMVKEVPLTVNFLAGGGATEESVRDHYTITPSHIVLAGSEEELDAYTSINLGTIDLAKIIEKGQLTFPIPIGDTVENVSGVVEALVEVEVVGLETQRLETANIEIINAPEGVEALLVTQNLSVQLRGSREALDLVMPEYLRVVVDLKGVTLPAGLSRVPARVSLDGVTGAGVIGDYQISISLSDAIQGESP